MRRILASLILITTFAIVAATARADSSTPATSLATSTPPATVPTSSSFSLLEPSTWKMPQYDWNSFKIQDPNSWPFIPVPEVATDPNGGVTYGVLPVWLFTDDKDEITSILAPDINANSTLGPGGNFRYLAYPSSDTNWYAVAGAQETIARDVDIDYQTGRQHKKWCSFEGRFFFEKDPTERFFGTGNHSHEGNQSNYTTKQLYGEAIFGINFTDKLQLSMMERPRYVRIEDGGFTSVPSIFKQFPHQKGLNGGSEVLSQWMLQYDSRDSVDIPRSGTLGARSTMELRIADSAARFRTTALAENCANTIPSASASRLPVTFLTNTSRSRRDSILVASAAGRRRELADRSGNSARLRHRPFHRQQLVRHELRDAHASVGQNHFRHPRHLRVGAVRRSRTRRAQFELTTRSRNCIRSAALDFAESRNRS